MKKITCMFIALALSFVFGSFAVEASEEVHLSGSERTAEVFAEHAKTEGVELYSTPADTGALPGIDPDYVFNQDNRKDNGEKVVLGDIAVVYEDGTPVEDGVVFNLFNMTVMRNESVLYTTKDGKLSGIEMIAGKEYKIGFDVSNEYWHSLEVVGAYNSKKLIRIYARYDGEAPLYYDYFEGIDGKEQAITKIVVKKCDGAVQVRPTSCIMSLIIAHDGYYADAGAPFRIVCKDNGKGKTVISDEGALTFTADANLHYEIVLAENPTYKMKEKVDFIIQMDSKGIYWAIFDGEDIDDAGARLTYIDLERIDGKTDANDGKTKIEDYICGDGDGGSSGGSECLPQDYAFIYDTTKVTLSGMTVYEGEAGDCCSGEGTLIERPVKFVFYNASKQEFEATVESADGVLPDVELFKNHSYIVYIEDAEYMAPNYYLKLDESGAQPTCTKCYGKESGFYLYKRTNPVEDPARDNRVSVTLPVQIKQGDVIKPIPNIKVSLVSPLETIEVTSDASGLITAELLEDVNYVVCVEDETYSIESFPMTIKDKSEYGAGKYPYDHTSCGGVNGLYLCEKGKEHDRDTTLVCPSGATTATGMNFNGGRYELLGRILENVTVDALNGKEYEVLDVDVINMYRTELSKLAAGEFSVTRKLSQERPVEAVYYMDTKGALVEVPFNQDGDKVTFEMSTMSMHNNVIVYKRVFNDIQETDYFYDAVEWANAQNITTGKTPTEFVPHEACERAQIITFLWRLAGSPKAENREMPFVDVAEGTFYYEAVLWAVENGITTGTTPTTFDPTGKCARAQAVTLLWRMAGSEKYEDKSMPFVDVPAGTFYYDAVLWAVENGITTGTSPTTFEPVVECSRAQIVTFMYRQQ